MRVPRWLHGVSRSERERSPVRIAERFLSSPLIDRIIRRTKARKQLRVIRKSGRCFRAIPWLVRAYHRVARHPTTSTREPGSPPIELPRGLFLSFSPFLSLSLSPSYRLQPTTSSHFSSSISSPSLLPPFPLRVELLLSPSSSVARCRLNSNSKEGSIMDPAGFPVYSIRIIWHPVDVRREEAGEEPRTLRCLSLSLSFSLWKRRTRRGIQ